MLASELRAKTTTTSCTTPMNTPPDHMTNLCLISVEGVDTKALIDTGATACLISEEFMESNPILKKRPIDSKVNVKATSVNDEPVHILGEIHLDIKMGNLERKVPFLVARNVAYPILLGWNFLKQNGILIDAKAGVMRLGKEQVPFLPKWRAFPRVCSARMKCTETIPARCERVIEAYLDPVNRNDVILDGYVGVLEPKDIFQNDQGLMIARTVGKTKNRVTMVKIMNVGNSPVDLHKDTSLGSFYAAAEQGERIARVGVYEIVQTCET